MDTSDASLMPSSSHNVETAREKERANLISRLDVGYSRNEPLGKFVTQMIEDGWSFEERNRIILESDYAQDPAVSGVIMLFGVK